MMKSPDFTAPFDVAYDSLSMYREWLKIPKWCNIYDPSNSDEFECIGIIQPAPEKGATAWTMNNKRVLIGVFRDEGRATQVQDVRIVQWARYATRLIISSNRPHFLKVGDLVTLWNVNVGTMTAPVKQVFSNSQFEVKTNMIGAESGVEGAYQPMKPVNFYDDFIVFRLLPSMSIVPWPTVLAILNVSGSQSVNTALTLFDVAKGQPTRVASSLVAQAGKLGSNGILDSSYINRQQINEDGDPISGQYDAQGKLLPSTYRYSGSTNAPESIVDFSSTDPCACSCETRLRVFDYYGFELNDDERAPYNAFDNVTYSQSTSNGLAIKMTANGNPIYAGVIQDQFGNIVTGAKSDTELLIRQAILPIEVDQFNVPYAAPRKDIA
jgi:hypothetical protein